ncbi:MAG: DUF1178 family protein [Marivibrio sp.]|uniref:DUF1178 family protein n=1 Tax=Marivibrio sp. TaxID=2039719 RepID=UPI0032EC56F2
MISFNLRCSKDHEFEGWFRDSATFEKDLKNRRIECPICGDSKLERALSAPNIATSESRAAAKAEQAAQARDKMRDTLRAFRRHVEKTSENVGDRFAEEARKIHYGESATRSIYGKTSLEEARDLHEEGVPVAPIPWIEEVQDN